MSRDKLTQIVTTTTGKQITRRGVVKGAAGLGAAAAASSAFAVPMINAQEKGNVVFWTTHTDTGLAALQMIGEEFNAQSETSVVEVVQRPAAEVDDSSSLITAVRGGQGPDTYLLDRFIVAERAAQGLLQDLGPLLEEAGENPDLSEKYVDFSAAEATYNGTPFALPFDTDVRALFYNRTMLSEAGVDLEPFNFENGPMTFDAVAEVANTLNVDDGDNFSQVGFVPYIYQGHAYTYGFAFGGEYFNYETCELTPDNERVVAGEQWVYDYSANLGADKLYAFAQNAMRPGAPPTDNPFLQGRLGMMINGNWMFAQFAQHMADGDVGYTFIPVPAEGDTSVTWAGGWSGVVPQGARNVEGGFEFLRYLAGPNGSRTYVQNERNLPVLRELLDDASLFDENLQWFVENLFPNTKNRPPLPVGARYWRELENAHQAVYLNTTEAAEAMASAKENTQVDLDAGGYCPIEAP